MTGIPRPGYPAQQSALTVRERSVAALAGRALSNREIARHLFISPHTVNFHLRSIYRKLGIRSRVDLARLSIATVADLFHVTDRMTWSVALRAGEYRMSSRNLTLEQQGFVHCALRHQIRDVAQKLYRDAHDLVVLVIDSARVQAPVRYEASAPGGERYPRVYGAIPVAAVTEVIEVGRHGLP
jgi:uncharacterized protein (DUF952 family)/DNA-binding CsgD family transcriptional regulator